MSRPIPKRIPGGYQFVWTQEGLKATVKRLIDDHRGATSAEVTFQSTKPPYEGHLCRQHLNLLSATGKKSLVQALRNSCEVSNEWDSIVESLCVNAVDLHREGEPIVEVGENPFREGTAYRLDPLIPEGQPAILFGPGGTFKSYFALLVSVLVQSGYRALGLDPKQGNVLYIDYETSAQEVNERLQAICRGLDHAPVRIPYRFCSSALENDIEGIQNAVSERDISLVVVDSLGPACGGDPNAADAIIRMFAALRSLHCSCLLNDHVAKNANTSTPFGSVYKINLSRSVWELTRVQKGQGIRVGLVHRKCNDSRLHDPMGFEIGFCNDHNGRAEKVTISRMEQFTNVDQLSEGLSVAERVYNILLGGRATVKEMAERIGKDEAQVRNRANDLVHEKKVRRDPTDERYFELGSEDDIPVPASSKPSEDESDIPF